MTIERTRDRLGALRVGATLGSVPATAVLAALIVACGVLGRGLWEPFTESPWFDVVAYGLPAWEAGRWWTPVTGAFFVAEPWVYVPTLLGLVGVAVLEYLRGWRVALAYFWIGHLFAVMATALVVWVASFASAWVWAQETAATLDVGASAGAFACIAAVAGMLRTPWRARVWLVLLVVVTIGVLFLGTVADIEHLAAVLLVLGVDRSLDVHRATVREQRFLAFLALVSFAVVEVIVALVPTNGPFGATEPLDGSLWTTGLDVLVVLLIADGLRRARHWAWVIAVVLLSINAALAGALLALIVFAERHGIHDLLDGEASIDIATGVLALLLLIYLVAVRAAFQRRRTSPLGSEPHPTGADVREALRAHGAGTLSWMTTWDGNQYLRVPSGVVAYQQRAGTAIVLGDPITPEDARTDAVAEFIARAEAAGLTPCFFSCGESTRQAAPASWRSLVVADDTIVDLTGLEFTGKRWASVRTSMNRAGREDVTFRMTRWADEAWGVRAQLRAISDMWVGDKGLPEMGFTLGTLHEAEDDEVRLALAVSSSGDVEGFLTWLPVLAPGGAVRGWTLDLMRRRDGGFPPVMEFLIGMSAAHFRDEGAEIMSLSGAPLAHEYPPEARLIAELSTKLADALEPVYGFQSLHRFKEKFHPRYETMYLLFRDEADLPRIAAGLTRAFLPDATARQFASAGLEIVRGDRS